MAHPLICRSLMSERFHRSRRQRNPRGRAAVEGDFKGVGARLRQGHVEHQDRAGLQLIHPGGGFTKLDCALAAEQFLAVLIDKTDPDVVASDLRTPAPDPEDEVGPGVHGREGPHPHVLENAEYGQLALLVDQGVVRENREIEAQVRPPGWR